MTALDWVLLALMFFLAAGVIAAGGIRAEFTPVLSFAPLTWGFAAYCVFLSIPTALHIKEALQWRISISKI